MPFQDKENLTDLSIFGNETYFNNDVTFYGQVSGLEIDKIKKNNSNVTVNDNETVTVTTNNVGIVTFSQQNTFIQNDLRVVGIATFTQSEVSIGTTVTFGTSGIVQQLFENVNTSSTALTGTINLDVLSGTLFYFTTNASADWTFNVRGNSSTSLNDILPVGKSVTITVLSTQGSSAKTATTLKIDGITIAPKWQNGVSPSGIINSINAYTYSIIKTADSTFTVCASLIKFS